MIGCAVPDSPTRAPRAGTGNSDDLSNPTQPPLGTIGPAGSVTPIPPPTATAIDQTGVDNPAGLSAAEVQQLLAGGPLAGLKWLYPYDGTVFPRGTLAPLLMWNGGPATAVFVHLRGQAFDYRALLRPGLDASGMAPQLQLPQEIWDKAGQQTQGKSDPYTLELTVSAAGSVQGPITLSFSIAPATLKGSIYYNSYASKLPGAALGGNVLRIPAGGKVELFLSTRCNGCHSVSADGSRMLSQIEIGSGGNSFQLRAGGAPNPSGSAAGPRAAFGALYPDGSRYLSTSVAISVGHADIAQASGTSPDATLYDTASGQPIADTGIPPGALMPMFSADGKRLVFNDYAIGDGQGLAVMDYDTRSDKASGYRVITTDSGTRRPGWPFFLPDGQAVVYARTESADFSANGAFIGAGAFAVLAGPFASLATLPVMGPYSELHIADVASGTVTVLAKAMGYATPAEAATGVTTLPFPDDLRQSYFPTVAPVAAGGYFWVFFDAIRHYGNLGMQRQLWGAALDISPDGSYVRDPSHPAFYLPGQEFGAGNHRAFATLDPCRKDGERCSSGIDCCGGTCSLADPANEFDATGTCAPQQNGCAARDERCASDADCCAPSAGQPVNMCIAGFCAFVRLD